MENDINNKLIKKNNENVQENIKKDLINELKDSKEFYREIKQEIVGEIADDIVTKEDQSSILKNLEDLNNRQIEMESNINILSETVDSKSEIR